MDDLDSAIDAVSTNPQRGKSTLVDRLDFAINDVVRAGKGRASAVAGAAMEYNHDQVAQARNLGRDLGIPLDVAERNPEDVRRKYIQKKVAELYDTSPVTGRRMGDPNFAKIALDSMDELAGTEQAIKKLTFQTQGFAEASKLSRAMSDQRGTESYNRVMDSPGEGGRTLSQIATDPLKSFASGANNMLAGIAEAGRYNPVEIAMDKALKFIAPSLWDKKQSLRNDVQGSLNEFSAWWQTEKSPDMQARIHQMNTAGLGDSIRMLITDPGLMIDQLAQSVPYLVPGGIAARGGAVSTLIYNSLQEAFDSANSARQTAIDNGATPEEQDRAAGIAALITAPVAFLGNKIPGVDKLEADFFTKGRPGHNLISSIVRESIAGAFEEGGNQLGQNIGQYTYDDSKDVLEGVGKAAGLGALLESTQGAGMHIVSRVMERMGQIEADSTRAQSTFDAFSNLNKMAAESAFKQRSAQDFNEFVQEAGGENNVPDVYVDARTFNQSAMDAGIDMDTLMQSSPAVGQQLQEAMDNGTDLVIPLGEFAANIAGTPLGDAVLPHLRSDADAISAAEAQKQLDEAVKSLQSDAENIAQQQADADAWQASTRQVEDIFREQLSSVGRFTQEQNSAYIKGVVSPFYTVLANELGITPLEAYQRYQLNVSSELGQGNRLDQSAIDMPEFKKWFGDSKVVDADGKPLVVYHGTDQSFDTFQQNSRGVYFVSPSAKWVSEFRRNADGSIAPGENVMPVYVSVKNPFDYENNAHIKQLATAASLGKLAITEIKKGSWSRIEDRTTLQAIKSLGFDGVYVKENGVKNIAVFKPEQIKSATGNRGTFDPKDPNILMSRGEGEGIPMEDAKRIVDELHASHPGVPKANVVERATDIPGVRESLKAALQEAKSLPPEQALAKLSKITVDDIEGAFVNGQIYLVASNLSSEQRLREVFAHEAIGHMSIEAMLDGEKPGTFKQFVDQVDALDKSGDSYIRSLADEVDQRQPGLDQSTRAQEIIALIAERGDQDMTPEARTLWQRIMDAVKAFGKLVFNADLTAQDVRDIVGMAARYARGENADSFVADKALYQKKEKAPRLPKLEARGAEQNNRLNQSDQNINDTGDARASITFGPDITQGATISLFKNADLSSFIHESGHFFLEVYSDIASRPDAPEKIRNDMANVMGWFGIKDIETWRGMSLEQKRPYHEKFARGFEQYAFNGVSPNTELRRLFQRFREFMLSAYKNLRDFLAANGDEKLTDEVTQVFDRMLATDEQIAQAQAVRGMIPMGMEALGMSADEYANYLQEQEDATGEAKSQVDSRALRDMKWLRNARSRVLKDLQAQAADVRAETREQVKAQVDAMPLYRAMHALKSGEIVTDSETIKAEQGFKLDIDTLESMYPETDLAAVKFRTLGYGKYGMLAKDGLHPDVVAEIFGFSSGDQMVRELVDAEPPQSMIDRMTDARMLQEHADLVNDRDLQQAADEAVHNELRAKLIATELAAQSKAIGNRRVLDAAAKEIAARKIASTKVGELRPSIFDRAEVRAAKSVEAAMRKGDTAAAVRAKRDLLVNNRTYKEAVAAKAEIDKALKGFAKIFRSDEKVAKGRDINLVNAARAVLAAHGLGQSDKTARSYLDAVARYDQYTYESILPLIDDLDSTVDYKSMTVEEFRAMRDKVDSLWKISRRSKQIEIDGELLERDLVADELIGRLNELGLPEELPGYKQAMSKWDKTKIHLMGARASLRRVEHWVSAMDGTKSNVFRKYIWNPISDAASAYRVARVDYLQRYLDMTKGIEGTLDNSKISAPEIGYTFTGKTELLHALMHTGNNSNMAKLILGRNWGYVDENGMLDTSRWQAFMDRMHSEGKITKADWDFVQNVWDLLEQMKPAAQKSHFDMYGYYFNEITANPVQTPFGEYRGGYMPAIADPYINTDAATRADKDALEQDGNSYMFPTTGRGFTKGRVDGYNKPLALDLRYIPSHIDKVLRFTHIEPHIKDVGRLITGGAFRPSLDLLDQTVASDMLIPWLQRTAQQMVEVPSKSKGGKAADWFFKTVRRNTGLQIMVGNVVNTLQQVTGLSVAAVKVKPRYLRNALWTYMRSPKETAADIAERSDFMATRMTAQSFEIQKSIDDLLLNPSTYEKARQFAMQHGYFMQAGFQNVVDTIVWSGAYSQAAEQGLVELEAIRAADAAVRQTQGSFSPEDVSSFETGSVFMRAFTQFYNYFNMQANLLGTEFATMAREMGLRKGAGRGLYVYTFGFMIPAVLAEVINQALGGGLDDDDDDGYLDDVMSLFFGSQFRTATAMVPGGNVVNAVVNQFNDKWYDDKLTTSPSVSMIESTVRAPKSVYEAIAEDGSQKRAVKDTLTAVGMLTGMPIGVLGRPLGYLADENADPENGWDLIRGLVTGRDVEKAN